jgi:hypothetical protein
VIDMKTEGMPSRKSAPQLQAMSLGGAEAMELYLAEIERNLAALKGEVGGLKSALAERSELLKKI